MKKYLLISIIIAGNLFAQTNSESNDFSYPLKLYNQSFYDLAAQQFVQFYNNHPASSKVPEAKYYAGMSYYKQGKFNQARIEFQSAAIEHPGSNRAGECWFKTGDCYVKLDEKEEAAKAYETIRLLYPENPLAPEGLYKAGILYAQIDKNDKAMQLLRVIMDRYNTSEQYFPAMVQMAQSFYKTDELQKANDLLEKVLNSTTDKAPLAEAYLLKAKISQSQGDFNSAKNYYQTIIDKYPQSDYFSQASIALSELLIYEGQFNQAKDIITTAISREKDKIHQNYMHGLLGDIYFLDGKYALAIKEYDADTGNEGKSGLPLIPVKKAIAKYKQNYVSDAAQELSVLLDNKTNFDEKTYDLLFEVYIKWLAKAGKKQQAINALFNHINGLKSQQNKVKFSAALAELLRQQGQWREIVQLLQPYLFVSESYPEMDDIIYYLGLANEQLGEYKQSAHFYRRLINEFGASVYYDKASEHLEYLNSYKIVDIDQTVLQMANILGKSLDEKVPSTELLLEHARMYYDKLKNYEGAKIQLQAILQKNPDKPGDVYLLLGKTYLKLAEKDPDGSAESRTNVKKANENFKLAVANIESCSRPDEASWMRIDAGLSIDTLGVAREKTLIEALINKYPNSPLMEEWFRTLAYSLSFNESYFETAESYFKQLISKYKSSDYYPSYLYAYAQLINDKNDEDAQKIYKQIASGYSKSSVAANALVHVAEDYRMKNMYNEAYTLYKKLIDTYYYANIAQENINKLAMTALKAGNYDAVIDIVGDKIYPEFAMDIVISKELLGKDIENYIYLLAKANEGKSNPKIALDYLQQYLNIAIAGIYVNDARFDIGKIFFNQNQKGMALENFKLISPKDKDLYRQARLYMGEIYFQLGDFKQAASIYSEISDLIKDPAVLVKVKAQRIVSLIRLGNCKKKI
ncbi:MAG: tetratricopeptide repeat protein [Calditrichaceae bacterium]